MKASTLEKLATVLTGRVQSGRLDDEGGAVLVRHRLLQTWAVESGAAARWKSGEPQDDLDRRLRASYMTSALKSALVMEAAHRAREALVQGGVSALFFKGAALVRNGVYSGPAARALGDADLLVLEADAGRAVELLESAGFEPWVPFDPSRTSWLPALAFSDRSTPPGMEVSIDLHWRIPYTSFRSGSESEFLWARADLEAGLPAPEEHAVLLAEHFVRHLRVQPHLIGLADLFRCLATVDSPVRLERLARARGSERSVRALLRFGRDELGARLPTSFESVAWLSDRNDPWTSRLLGTRRLSEDRVPGPRWFDVITHGIAFQGALGSLRQVSDVVFPPGRWLEEWHDGGPDTPNWRRRVDYWRSIGAWLTGRGVSPLSPHQEFEESVG